MILSKPITRISAGLVLLGIASLNLSAQEENESPGATFDDTRLLLQQWQEAEQAISTEKNDWRLAEQILKDRISLVESEIEQLNSQIVEAKENIIKADEDKQKVIKENEDLKAVATELDSIVVKLESDLRSTIVPKLTDPAKSRLEVFIKRIPDQAENDKLSMSQRFSNVVGLLDQINKLNGEIILESELRNVDGKELSVQSMYLGLGQAFYVTNQNDRAGVGRPGATGWEWTPVNDRAPEIAKAIAISNGDTIAEFVPVPIEISK
ncbi:MAG: DUF3450 family protein [Verrucomicrobiota bacterium]